MALSGSVSSPRMRGAPKTQPLPNRLPNHLVPRPMLKPPLREVVGVARRPEGRAFPPRLKAEGGRTLGKRALSLTPLCRALLRLGAIGVASHGPWRAKLSREVGYCRTKVVQSSLIPCPRPPSTKLISELWRRWWKLPETRSRFFPSHCRLVLPTHALAARVVGRGISMLFGSGRWRWEPSTR